jgi:tyrosyl-tRNA synthetase
MTVSEELTWRGFVHQTTFKDLTVLDATPIAFYFGVDPSADSMQIGNLAAAMMVKCLIKGGHTPFLLIGGATGLIGDPDGKASERDLKSLETITHNKQAISAQYDKVFDGQPFTLVDNYDWFKDFKYLDFLRQVGKHVPMRQMLGREFVQSRLGEDGAGISYAEFSYSLIQGYDFLHLFNDYGVTLQVCGADQWGNSIAGVDLIRRITGSEAHVYSTPLILNKATGQKFGKSEAGAVWLDPNKTSPTQFYQFWINLEDDGIEDYLKVYTEFDKPTIDQLIAEHSQNPAERRAQTCLAEAVTALVHGLAEMEAAQTVTNILTNRNRLEDADDRVIAILRAEQPSAVSPINGSVIDTLEASGLASSKSDARRLVQSNAISVNGQKIDRDHFIASDFIQNRLLLRRGKAFKDTALIEVA